MLRTFFARLALSALGLLLVELALQGVVRINSRVALALSPGLESTVPDDLLRRRPNPAVQDHDAAGWRNPEVLAHPSIVILGDSQTYGDEVSQHNAWPLLLGEELGVESYNIDVTGNQVIAERVAQHRVLRALKVDR